MKAAHTLSYENFEPRRAFFAAVADARLHEFPIVLHDHADFAEAFYVTGGSGIHVVEAEEIPLRVGHVVVVAPSDAHTFRSDPVAPLAFINVAFPVEPWEQALAGLEFQPGVSARNHTHAPQLSHVFEQALQDFPSGTVSQRLRFFGGLLAGLEERVSDSNGPPWLVRALNAMRTDECLRGGLDRLRELACVSDAHLSRAVRASTGLSPSEWIRDERLVRAGQLLRQTSWPIDEIAYSLGFENVSYFYRRFRIRHGVTPNQFRRDAAARYVGMSRSPEGSAH